MHESKKIYKAIVYNEQTKKFGKRVTVEAIDINEASKILDLEYGEGNYIDLHNEESASKPR